MANRDRKRCSTSLIITEITKSKPQEDITLHLSEQLPSKRTQITKVGKDVEKRETRTLLVGMQTRAATMENRIEIPKKTKNRIII